MVFFIFYSNSKNILWVNRGDPERTPRSVVSDLGLRCLSMSNKKGATCRLIWVN